MEGIIQNYTSGSEGSAKGKGCRASNNERDDWIGRFGRLEVYKQYILSVGGNFSSTSIEINGTFSLFSMTYLPT
jgi:hypothetical protein